MANAFIRSAGTDAAAGHANGRSLPVIPIAADHDEADADIAETFGAFLAEENIVDRAVLDRARRAARTTGERFDRVLTKLGLISESDLATALSRHLSIPMASPAHVPAQPILPDVVGPDFVRRNRVMPLAVSEGAL